MFLEKHTSVSCICSTLEPFESDRKVMNIWLENAFFLPACVFRTCVFV